MAELTEQARKLLHGRNFGFLATVMEDGSPHVSPVWVVARAGQVPVNTGKGGIKERKCRRDPRAAF